MFNTSVYLHNILSKFLTSTKVTKTTAVHKAPDILAIFWFEILNYVYFLNQRAQGVSTDTCPFEEAVPRTKYLYVSQLST